MIKLCGPNWCKDKTEINVSSSLEQPIEEKRKRLGFDGLYDEDPYLQEMVLPNLHMVSIFAPSSLWMMYASRRWSVIKTNCGSQMFKFMESASLIQNSSDPMKS